MRRQQTNEIFFKNLASSAYSSFDLGDNLRGRGLTTQVEFLQLWKLETQRWYLC